MKIKIHAILALVIIFGAAIALDAYYTSQTPTLSAVTTANENLQDAPDFKFQTRNGKFYNLRSLSERGIVLHFWASWCAPCAAEFPALLQKIHDQNGNLALVAVSIDDDPQAMDRFVAHLKWHSDPHIYWVWDEKKNISLKTFNTVRPPETILINASRKMSKKIIGDPDWNKSEQFSALETLVEDRLELD